MPRVCHVTARWAVPLSLALETGSPWHCSFRTSFVLGKHGSPVNPGGSFFGSSSFQLRGQHLSSDTVVSVGLLSENVNKMAYCDSLRITWFLPCLLSTNWVKLGAIFYDGYYSEVHYQAWDIEITGAFMQVKRDERYR